MEQPFNLVSNATLKKNVADYTLIVIGAFLQALSYSLFLAPYKIVPGGVYGISIVLHHVTQGLFSFMPEGLPMGATALCFNVPLLLLAMKKLGLASGPKVQFWDLVRLVCSVRKVRAPVRMCWPV